MDAGYEPLEAQSVATKAYVDDGLQTIIDLPQAVYHEYPASQSGDTSFNATLVGTEFSIFKNGVLQRRTKYTYTDTTFTFNDVLDDGDEVTLTILGAS